MVLKLHQRQEDCGNSMWVVLFCPYIVLAERERERGRERERMKERKALYCTERTLSGVFIPTELQTMLSKLFK